MNNFSANIMANLRNLVGLPENASEAEIDQGLQSLLDDQNAAAETDPEATPQEGEQAPTASTEIEQAEEPTTEETAEGGNEDFMAAIEAVEARIMGRLDAVEARIKNVENAPAAEATGGKTEASGDSNQPIWMRDPINVRASSLNRKNK